MIRRPRESPGPPSPGPPAGTVGPGRRRRRRRLCSLRGTGSHSPAVTVTRDSVTRRRDRHGAARAAGPARARSLTRLRQAPIPSQHGQSEAAESDSTHRDSVPGQLPDSESRRRVTVADSESELSGPGPPAGSVARSRSRRSGDPAAGSTTPGPAAGSRHRDS